VLRTLKRPDIAGLEWDEHNERQVEERIDSRLIDELIEGGN
jgi:hypothetical protein